MPKKITTEEFIKRAKEVHGSKYSYTDVVYASSKSKVLIRCLEHGVFEQLPTNHLKGCGCPKCQYVVVKKALTKTTKDFVLEAESVHKGKYVYDDTEYQGNKEKVTITCPVHGDFEQEAKSHLNGAGCSKCADAAVGKQLTNDTHTFVGKAQKIHNDKYRYNNTQYKNAKTKVVITCPEHGEFSQTPNQHLNGQGCLECAKKKFSMGPGRWSYSEWEKAGKVSDNFDGYSLYVIRCVGNGESFIKVGKTFIGVGKRFAGGKLPYKFTIETQVYYNAYAISNLEKKIHKLLKGYSYQPNRSFGGDTECFTLEALESAVKLAEE